MKSTPIEAPELLKYFPQTVFTFICDVHKPCTDHKLFTDTVYDGGKFTQANEKTYGAFFTVNGFASGRRIAADITTLNAVYGDLDVCKDEDGMSTEVRDQKKRDLYKKLKDGVFPPGFIIVTKNGLQPIWLLHEATPKDAPRAVSVINGIIKWSKENGAMGDAVKDVARVLRLPGYLHKKSDPYFIKAFQLHTERIRLDDLEEEYRYFDDAIIFADDTEVYRELGTLDSVSMRDIVVKALPQSNLGVASVSFDSEGRIVTDRLTAAYIGRHGDREYVASTGKIPAGNKITFVRRLLDLPDNKEAYRWIAENFNLKTKHTKLVVTHLASLAERTAETDSGIRYMTGFERVDNHVGGFRLGNTYLVGAIEKAGKSSLVSSFVTNFLKNNIPCGYLNTELPSDEFYQRMTANELEKPFEDICSEEINAWKEQKNNILQYAGVSDLATDGIVALDKTLVTAEFMVKNGAKILVFDNLTTFSNSDGKQEGWARLGDAMSRVINFSKIANTCVFVVVHAKQDASWVESPENIKRIIKSEEPHKMFEESHTVVRRPQLADILGGTSAKSHLSGAILVWRPFQKLDSNKMSLETAIILESFRHANGSAMIRVIFNAKCYSFSESYFQSFQVKESVGTTPSSPLLSVISNENFGANGQSKLESKITDGKTMPTAESEHSIQDDTDQLVEALDAEGRQR